MDFATMTDEELDRAVLAAKGWKRIAFDGEIAIGEYKGNFPFRRNRPTRVLDMEMLREVLVHGIGFQDIVLWWEEDKGWILGDDENFSVVLSNESLPRLVTSARLQIHKAEGVT